MNESHDHLTSRREFLKTTGKLAAASALAGVALPHVHAAGSDVIQLALIGCGGRGTGAAANALATSNQGPVKLVAMADVFENRLKSSFEALNADHGDAKLRSGNAALKGGHSDKIDVPEERRFIGFDAYKNAMDCLKPGDIAIFTTPPAFRWVHFAYAIEKNLNVFMEKPVTVDGPTTRRMLELGEQSVKKNLKVGVGLMCRHCNARKELFERVKGGEIGDIIALRAYRMHGPVAYAFSQPKPDGITELMYQVQRFHSFLWASGGLFSDFYIHNIDEACWMKDALPVKAHANGGRHFRGDQIDQNFDNYSVEYTFDDGTKFFFSGRTISGCHDEFATYAHGTKGLAVVSSHSHTPAKCRTFKGHNMERKNLIWSAPQPEANPYQLEWDHLVDAIRNDKPFNEVKRGSEISLATSLGRMAAHTGQVVTWDDILNSDHEFAPDVDKLTPRSVAPLLAGSDGKYPMPQPGITKKREY